MARILITGATAGIGRAAAILLAHKGHTVIGAGRNVEALESLAAQAPNLHALPLDVTDPAAVAGAPAAVAALTGGEPLDILVNNAGYACVGPLECVDDDALEAQYQVNVFGLLRVTRAFLPAMRERGSGRIVNVSSVAGITGVSRSAAYATSKAGLIGFSRYLAMSLKEHGIGVSVVAGAGTARIANNLIARSGRAIVGMDRERVVTGELARGGDDGGASNIVVSGNTVS